MSGGDRVGASSVLGSKEFADHLSFVGTATQLPLQRVFSPKPQSDLEECKGCDRELMVWDDGNNVYTVNFLLETLATKCKLGQDFCIGVSEQQSELVFPFRVCLARSALRHMLEVYRLGEIVNRSNSGFLVAQRQRATRGPIDPSRLLRRAERAANRMVADIRSGLFRITTELHSSSAEQISPKSVGRVRVLAFHGHQLREAARGDIEWHVYPKPDIVTFAHYHRLWVFEYHRMICVISGCWMLTFPKYEIVLFPSIGVPLFEFSRTSKAFRIKLRRYGAGAPDMN